MRFLPVFIFMATSFGSIAMASKDSFAKQDIVFPVGRSEVQTFLGLLADTQNQKTVDLPKGSLNITDVPGEAGVVFGLGAESYMLYFDDFNNDLKKEYLIVYLHSGSGKYSGVQGAYSLDGKVLTSLKWEEKIVQSLFPGKDLSQLELSLAKPFAVRRDKKIYQRFLSNAKSAEVTTYLWQGEKFSRVHPK